MSVTDGRIRTTYGNIQIPKTQVKRAYERLRKRSYRAWWRSEQWHRAYVQGLSDMANAITDSNLGGI